MIGSALAHLAVVLGTMGVGMAPGCIAAYLNERNGGDDGGN